MLIDGDAILMRWPATTDRPFNLEARYSFPMPNLVRLEVTVAAKKELIDFEVQVGSYFDKGFPSAGVLMGDGKFVSSPAKLGTWHAFPRDAQAKAIIGDGRWKHDPNPVEFVIRPSFASPVSIRRHTSANLQAPSSRTRRLLCHLYRPRPGTPLFELQRPVRPHHSQGGIRDGWSDDDDYDGEQGLNDQDH